MFVFSEYGWLPMGDELRAVPNNCLITLSIALDIVHNGKITIEYKNTYQTSTSFFIKVNKTDNTTLLDKEAKRNN